jgi:exodeoxyribonuclease III
MGADEKVFRRNIFGPRLMKFISWNVNGIRAAMKNGFEAFIKKEKPDVLCIQESKAHPGQVYLPLDGYQPIWNSAKKKGYSGTIVFTKIKPLKITYGLGIAKHDDEGRVITVEFKSYYLVNVYTPNSKRDLARLAYRTREWDVDFLKYLKKIEKKKPVIFCGDLNVAHKEIDLANPQSNRRNAGFTHEERASFDHIVKSGFIDTFREFNQEGGNYTWWSYMHEARSRNIGWRIDYFCVSPVLRKRLQQSVILSKVMGSDHCPVAMEFKS